MKKTESEITNIKNKKIVLAVIFYYQQYYSHRDYILDRQEILKQQEFWV